MRWTSSGTGPGGGAVRLGAAGLVTVGLVAALGGCKVTTPGADDGAGGPVTFPSGSRTATAPSRGATTPAPSRTPSPPAPPSSPPPARPSTPDPAPSAPALPASGQRSSQVRELQARLWTLGHFRQQPTGYYGSVTAAAVSAYQGAEGLPRTGRTDAATWQRLRADSKTPGRAELYPVTTLPVTAPDARCRTGRALCISKKSRTLAWMVDGRTVSVMDVRFGSAYTPTRDGTFKVGWKSRHHISTLYDSPMPYAMFFSGGQAVHYSSDFAARGYAGASHGCVNVRDEKKIAALFATVRTGDKVIVY